MLHSDSSKLENDRALFDSRSSGNGDVHDTDAMTGAVGVKFAGGFRRDGTHFKDYSAVCIREDALLAEVRRADYVIIEQAGHNIRDF